MKNVTVIAASLLTFTALSAQAGPRPVPENITYENIVDQSGSILPYHESFELNGDSTPHYDIPFYSRNTWRYDWTIEQIGKSDVPATGPRKASDGIAYTYLETSPGGAFTRGNKAVYQMSFEYNPTTYQKLYVEDSVVTFDYHMFGADIGRLALEGRNINGEWKRVWSIAGAQQNRSNDKWITQTVNITKVEKLTGIRFVGIAVGGAKGEIAIDNIHIDSTKRTNRINFNTVDVAQNSVQVNWDHVGEKYKRFVIGESLSGEKKWIHTFDSALQYDYDNLTWGHTIEKEEVCNKFGPGRWDISLQVWSNRNRNTASNITDITSWVCN